MRRIRLGVAGLGRIGLVHASNLAGRIALAELVRAVDADEARASSVAARLDVDWSTSFDSLLAYVDARMGGRPGWRTYWPMTTKSLQHAYFEESRKPLVVVRLLEGSNPSLSASTTRTARAVAHPAGWCYESARRF
jgi:GFO/IDH/MocA oxidoreductase family protein